MNTKYHVSLEVAKMLKELGYNEETSHYYNSAGKLYLGNGHFNYNAYAVNLSAPTKAEAIDWLESKGMCIIVFRRTIDNKVGWRYVIHGQTEFISGFSTRLQAEGAAIFKALKLLNRKEE
jgi:hypothetical protein